MRGVIQASEIGGVTLLPARWWWTALPTPSLRYPHRPGSDAGSVLAGDLLCTFRKRFLDTIVEFRVSQ
jgi:hypothetical protein